MLTWLLVVALSVTQACLPWTQHAHPTQETTGRAERSSIFFAFPDPVQFVNSNYDILVRTPRGSGSGSGLSFFYFI